MDDGHHHLSLYLEGEGNPELREAAQKVRGPVEGIDDPTVRGCVVNVILSAIYRVLGIIA